MDINIENKKEIVQKIYRLLDKYHSGQLGGEAMPEDANPKLEKGSKENYIYFTLPMALNYQRNSYKLWKAALDTYKDKDSKSVFECELTKNMPVEELRGYLIKYKLALQPNKHIEIWKKNSCSIVELWGGDVRDFFELQKYSVANIKGYFANHKKCFPYLGGNKILNYWLYVIEQYTDTKFVDRENISVAPDTHVIQASYKLGIISGDELCDANVQIIVSKRWEDLLKNTELVPIDVHTPWW